MNLWNPRLSLILNVTNQVNVAAQLTSGRGGGGAGRDHSLRRWPGVCKDVIADMVASLKLCKELLPLH